MKNAFSNVGGRPADKVIVTSVGRRLEAWAKDIANGETAVRAVLLVGGPGNGKTDTVEQFVEALDGALGCNGELRARCIAANADVPRVLRVHIGELMPDRQSARIGELRLVQEASKKGDRGGNRPDECLIEELAEIEQDEGALYLCCLNRGILADALAANRTAPHHAEDRVRLLQAIAQSVAQGARPNRCWPLDSDKWLAVWPMDAESLFDGEDCAAGQIFRAATDVTRWTECSTCVAAARCPLKANRDALAEPETLDSLLGILRRYELSAGRRWTFRDVYSLVPELIVGHESDFQREGRCLEPCEWVRKSVAAAEAKVSSDPKANARRLDARLLIASRQYQHTLFGAWPSLHQYRKELRAVTKGRPNEVAAQAVFNHFGNAGSADGTHVRKLLRSSVCPILDPAVTDSDRALDGKRKKVREVETAFSRGVAEGTKFLGSLLSPIDRWALDVLRDAEAALEPASVRSNLRYQAERLQRIVRQIAVRYAKRSVLVRRGITKDHELFERYLLVGSDPMQLREVRRMFGKLLHTGQRFRVGLMRCVGQPRRADRKDAFLVTDRVEINAMTIPELTGDGKSPTTTPFLLIRERDGAERPLALTFGLYRSLHRLSDDCHPACLPPDVLALIQGVESRILGRRVRDVRALAGEDVYIELMGGKLFVQALPNGDFDVSAQRPS